HRIARIEEIQRELFSMEISFDEFEGLYFERLLDIMDGTGNLGKKSVGMKSYLLPYIGLIEPLYDRTLAAKSWNAMRKSYAELPFMER
ncbi:MAG: amidohydrolase, partial [Mesorhizobium sp.]